MARSAAYETRVHGRRPPVAPQDEPSGVSAVVDLRDAAPGAELGQLLTGLAGLRVIDSGAAGRKTLSMRGASSNQLVITLDGVRLTPPGGGWVDLALIDPAHLAQVEVRRSAGSARFADSAIGGALVLRTPRLSRRRHLSAGVAYGSFDSLAVRAASQGSVAEGRYWLSGSYRQSAGDFRYVDGNGREPRVRLNNDARIGELLLKLDYPLWQRWQLSMMDNLAVAGRGAPGMAERPSLSARQSDFRQLLVLQARRYGNWHSSDSLVLALRHRYAYFDFNDPGPPSSRSRNHRQALSGELRFELPMGRAGRLEAGTELRGEFFHEVDDRLDEGRLVAAIWLKQQTPLWADSVLVVPALRVMTVTGVQTVVVPQAGVLLRPLRWLGLQGDDRLSMRANVGRRFRPPSFEELFVRFDGFGQNAALRPEDALAWDLGLRWHSGRLRAEVVYFGRRMKNTILFAPVSPTLIRADNFSAVQVAGLESTLAVSPGWCVAAEAAYTLTHSRFSTPAQPLPGTPRHRYGSRLSLGGPACGSGRSALARALRSLSLWAAIEVQSSMFLGRFSSQPEEGRTLLSVGFGYSRYGLRLSAVGHNLLNKRDAVDTVDFPLPPARFSVSLSGRL